MSIRYEPKKVIEIPEIEFKRSVQGKYKTIFQFASIILLLWPKSWGTNYTIYIINKIGYISFWIALFLTLTSAIKYVFSQKEAHQS